MKKIQLKQIEGLTEYVQGQIADMHVEKIGYQGVLPTASPEGGVKGGMEFAVGTALTGTTSRAQVGDYLIAKEDFTYAQLPSTASDVDTFLAHFVIVEGNIKNVEGGTVENDKYVSGMTMANGVISLQKATLPVKGVAESNTAGSGTTTKAVTGLTMVNGVITPVEKDIALSSYPQAVETLTVANGSATLSHTPVGQVAVLMNGVQQTLGTDYTVAGSTVTILQAMGYAAGDELTAVYNYAS